MESILQDRIRPLQHELVAAGVLGRAIHVALPGHLLTADSLGSAHLAALGRTIRTRNPDHQEQKRSDDLVGEFHTWALNFRRKRFSQVTTFMR